MFSNLEAIKDTREKRDKDTVAEQSAKRESSWNRAAEQSNEEAHGMSKTLKSCIEGRIGKPLDGQAVFMRWLGCPRRDNRDAHERGSRHTKD